MSLGEYHYGNALGSFLCLPLFISFLVANFILWLSFCSARVGHKSCPIIYWSGRPSHRHSETKRVRPLVTYLLGPTPTLRGKHKSPFRLADVSLSICFEKPAVSHPSLFCCLVSSFLDLPRFISCRNGDWEGKHNNNAFSFFLPIRRKTCWGCIRNIFELPARQPSL